jgi:hypothetical protein
MEGVAAHAISFTSDGFSLGGLEKIQARIAQILSATKNSISAVGDQSGHARRGLGAIP